MSSDEEPRGCQTPGACSALEGLGRRRRLLREACSLLDNTRGSEAWISSRSRFFAAVDNELDAPDQATDALAEAAPDTGSIVGRAQEAAKALLRQMKAEVAELRSLMAEARDDFHGKSVLFASAYLKACEGADPAAHTEARLYQETGRATVAAIRRQRAEAERDASRIERESLQLELRAAMWRLEELAKLHEQAESDRDEARRLAVKLYDRWQDVDGMDEPDPLVEQYRSALEASDG